MGALEDRWVFSWEVVQKTFLINSGKRWNRLLGFLLEFDVCQREVGFFPGPSSCSSESVTEAMVTSHELPLLEAEKGNRGSLREAYHELRCLTFPGYHPGSRRPPRLPGALLPGRFPTTA